MLDSGREGGREGEEDKGGSGREGREGRAGGSSSLTVHSSLSPAGLGRGERGEGGGVKEEGKGRETSLSIRRKLKVQGLNLT